LTGKGRVFGSARGGAGHHQGVHRRQRD
jgi:hypothetical protein